MPRSVARRPSRRGPVRKRVWARTSEPDFTLEDTGSTAVDLGAGFADAYGTNVLPPGITIGACRINYAVKWTNTGPETCRLYMGLLVSSENEIAHVEIPYTDQHADWMAFKVIYGPWTATAPQTFPEWEVNSKRKLEEIGQRLWLSFELLPNVADTDAEVSISMDASVLLLMP